MQVPSKHKYAIVMGKDNRETKMLRRLFEERNEVLPYPKDRVQEFEVSDLGLIVEDTEERNFESQMRFFV